MSIKLVDDWKQAWKWSEMRIMFVISALLAAAPRISQMLSDNWPTVYPYIQTYFPHTSPTFWPAAGVGLAMIARVLEIGAKGGGNGSQ
ncbi:DUF7940 domain-containing protein [Burkholderia metallica]|uniref:DUF7940 domain-containing protein n=1 Tax=Burkholderia metallica TaxID=488729 RepID=UPI001CF50DE3|nr:hypothetical protein [Burkholderia metallica]MCA8018064.1 hypothetical protein [Burkholderia metallica]